MQITKEYLNAHRVAEMKKGPQGDARRDTVIGTSALSFDSPAKAASKAPASDPNEETVLIFTGGGETQISIDDAPEPAPAASAPLTADSGADVNTEKILKALIAALEEKGFVNKADIRKHLKTLS